VEAAASIVAYEKLPAQVALRFGGLLPFNGIQSGGPASRALVFLVPTITLLLWAAFRAAPTSSGQRVGRFMLPHAADEITDPSQFNRFGSSYETIVVAVVVLLIGVQAAILSALFQHAEIASRLIPIVFGFSLILMGNVMPRVRPNWVAGLRTRRLLQDPQLWRIAHRSFGTALVDSGILTIVVAIIAPSYGLITGIVTYFISCAAGFASTNQLTATSR
jgi:hypothetical protein